MPKSIVGKRLDPKQADITTRQKARRLTLSFFKGAVAVSHEVIETTQIEQADVKKKLG